MDKTLLTRGGRGPVGLPEDDVDLVIDGQAVTVRVRGMNRGEMLMLGKLSDDKGQAVAEQYMLSSCMLDPEMTEEDIADWQESGPGMESHAVVLRINELSGSGKAAEKSGVPEVRG